MSKKTTDVSNFALAGFGRFGRHHANVIANYPSSRLLAIAEPNELALEKARKEFPEATIFKAVSYTHLRANDTVLDIV